MNGFVLRISVLIFTVFSVAYSVCDTVSYEETIEIEQFECFHSKTAIGTKKYKAILISGNGGVETFGISGKLGLVGPVCLKGLLREIESPLGYSPFSDLRNENSRLMLDGSLSNNYRKHGAFFDVLPGLFSVYTYGSDSNASKLSSSGINRFGFVFDWSSIIQRSDYFKGEILYGYNVLDGKTNNLGKTEWYPVLPLITSVDISHLAFLFESSRNTKAGELDYRFMFSLSGSKTIPQGYLSHLFVDYFGDTTEVGFFGGIKNNFYVNSKGDESDDGAKASIVFVFEPIKLFSLKSQYTRVLNISGFPLDNYLGGKEELLVDFKLRLINAFVVSFVGKKSFEYSTTGSITEKDCFKYLVFYSGRYVDLSMSLREPVTEIIFDFGLHIKPDIAIFKDIELKGKAKISFKDDKKGIDTSLVYAIDRNPGIKITVGFMDWQFDNAFKSDIRNHMYLSIRIRSKTKS